MDEMEREDDLFQKMKYKFSKFINTAKDFISPPSEYYIIKYQ
jgi:hypothetical protein